MGGSGGSFLRGTGKVDPDKLAKQIKDAQSHTRDKEYELKLSELFRDILAQINDRDHQKVNDLLSDIKDKIQSDIDGAVSLRFGGSISKHTYVDGLSDIDSLVFLNDSELANKSPNEVKDYFYKKIKSAFPIEEVSKGNLAVTVKFSDNTEIQLLPAVRYKTGYKIASSSNKWSNIINPDKFAKLLRGTNIKMKGKLLPVIKLTKAIISSLPKSIQLSGYHTEAISIEAFYNYAGERKTKPMLKHFFREASRIVLNEIKDKTGQSVNMDGYLGKNNSLDRKIISNKLDQIRRRMDNTDITNSLNYWNQLLK